MKVSTFAKDILGVKLTKPQKDFLDNPTEKQAFYIGRKMRNISFYLALRVAYDDYMKKVSVKKYCIFCGRVLDEDLDHDNSCRWCE